jgi:hypothetical protein
MHSVRASSVTCSAVPHFSTLTQKLHDFLKKSSLNIKCVLTLCTMFSETFLILRRIQLDSVMNVRKSLCKVTVILVLCFTVHHQCR